MRSTLAMMGQYPSIISPRADGDVEVPGVLVGEREAAEGPGSEESPCGGGSLLHDIDGAMVVAVIAVRVVQASFDEVVHVIAVGHGLVATPGAMLMIAMPLTRGLTDGRGLVGDGECVFVYVVAVGMMQVAVVKVVDMPVMLDGGVSAPWAVLMRVVVVLVALFHRGSSCDKWAQWVELRWRRLTLSVTQPTIRSRDLPDDSNAADSLRS